MYGETDPKKVIIQLVIDDGVPDRGHRLSIFNAGFKRVGICSGSHDMFVIQTVLDYNGS